MIRCKFVDGKCIVCGYEVEKINAKIIIRDCSEVKYMPIFYNRDNKPANIEGLFQGCACFYIGAGPSLLEQPLELLSSKGICTFAVNNIAAVVKPNLWTCCDTPKSFHGTIWNDPTIMKFVPESNSGRGYFRTNIDGVRSPVRLCPNTYLYKLVSKFNHELYLKENEVSWGVGPRQACSLGFEGGRSVMFAALKLIYALGFTRVYLLGCDFNMQHDPEEDGKGLTYAFSQYKGIEGCDKNNKCYTIMNSRFEVLRKIFEKANYTVINCTPKHRSQLTAFQFRDFRECIEEEQAGFSTQITTQGMYGR